MTDATPAAAPSVAAQRRMAEHLVAAVVDDATGVADGDSCIGEPPSARYYLASLAPADLNLAVNAVRMGRATPTALGFEFDVDEPTTQLFLSATLSCYYRVLPTRDEQLRYLGERVGQAADYRLAPVFRRVEVAIGPLAVTLDLEHPTVDSIGRDEFAEQFARVAAVAAEDPRVERRDGDERRERLVPAAALDDDDAFARWIASAVDGQPVLPQFDARMHLTSRRAGARTRVTVSLENLSRDPTVVVQGRGRSAGQTRHDESRDHFLFRSSLHVTAAAGVVRPIRMDLGSDAYRYNPELPGYATNCGVEQVLDERGVAVGLRSVAAPEYTTVRAVHGQHPAAAFATLAGADPLTPLRQLAQDLGSYADDDDWSTAGLDPELAARKNADRAAFATEAARFADGVEWLQRDPRLLLAFRLTNQTMAHVGARAARPHTSWRLFQLVFLVSQMAALAWREHPSESFATGLWGDEHGVDPTEAATVVWYPTGGGKTEAYLGVVVCCLFYDRARGKSVGTSAWCRFPLRLLSLQQTQRQLDVIAAADEVRVDAEPQLRAVGGEVGDPFRVGFYAGGANTPNSLTRDAGLVDRLRNDANLRARYRLVDTCPYCRERSVEVPPPDPVALRLEHVCTSCRRTLPIVVTDNEVYRYLPAVVVGTLDKLAGIGLSDRFGALLGDVDCLCPLHGYGRGGKCHERRAPDHPPGNPPALRRPLYDTSPTLEIVDELHMVDEEVGAFSGHYEGLLAAVQRVLSARTRPDGRGVRMKVIATTATIRGEDRQCDHLFGLRSVVVPLPGPSLESSFYWRLDHYAPARRFVGIMPTRTTAEMTLVRILVAVHTALRRLETRQAVPPSLASLPGAELDQLVDLYRTSLTYVTSLVDFGKIRRSLDTQVNEALRQLGYQPLPVAELKGETPFDQVRCTLDDLSRASGETEAVVATSMVSHGVDVDRLNLMVFNGMPRAMAEYIQASSRVGRAYLGVVFMIFNPVRERDRSHFRYHGKFHEYLDRMVEPVAINRWSRFAIRRTLPGVLMGHVLQAVNRAWWDAGKATTHLHDLTRMKAALREPASGGLPEAQLDALLDALHAAYLCDRPEALELVADLDDRVRRAVATLRVAGAAAGAAAGGAPRYRATGDHLGLEYPPMTSLRDVAEGMPFVTLSDRRA